MTALACALAAAVGCGTTRADTQTSSHADVILTNGRVYTLSWPDPAPDGTPSPKAPRTAEGWRPDAEVVAIKDGRILYVGSAQGVAVHRGPHTAVLDMQGGTVLPGLVDSHTHVGELGASLERISLVGVRTEDEAIERVVARAKAAPKGSWLVGWGWDEGAWANRYPDMTKLSERVPDHPVSLRGLHSFAVWGNRLAFEKAEINSTTKAPTGGEIRKDAKGQPSGILLNNARQLLEAAIPPPTEQQLDGHVRGALHALTAAGYVGLHEAGAGSALMESFERLRGRTELKVRVYAMLSLRDQPLVAKWLAAGPRVDPEGRLTVRTVKAFYDGALGSRGAMLLADYADRPGYRGLGGAAYDFDADRLSKMMAAGFQASIHAIGDAGNRAALTFLGKTMEASSSRTRHRIEHAQILNPADMPRFAALGVIASMQPSHASEDMPWAEARVGPARIKGAYAWRTLRRAGARLVFNSDLPGTDYNIFYGLHSAITRRNKERTPDGGWYPAERMTPEEALRGFTTWAAYASFTEDVTGTIAPGRWADLTVMDIDPFVTGETAPDKLLGGQIRFTIVGGTVVHRTDR